MIHGNITVSPRPDPDALRPDGVCSECEEPCREIPIDESYDDHFGTVTVWSTGSDCCQAEVIDEPDE